MRLLIMGPPGAGKGTQAALIKTEYQLTHISTGDMFRKAIKEMTPVGLVAQQYIEHGNLVPDEVTIEVIRERLSRDDIKEGFLLDGFPRSVPQAKALDEILANYNMEMDAVINIDIDAELIIERIVNRRICKSCGAGYNTKYLPPQKEGVCDICSGELYQRKDDNSNTIKSRLSIYDEQTKPLIEYYTKRNLIKNIDGTVRQSEMFEDIKTIIGGLNDPDKK